MSDKKSAYLQYWEDAVWDTEKAECRSYNRSNGESMSEKRRLSYREDDWNRLREIRVDTYTVGCQQLAFWYTDDWTEDELADFLSWLDLVKRKILRGASYKHERMKSAVSDALATVAEPQSPDADK